MNDDLSNDDLSDDDLSNDEGLPGPAERINFDTAFAEIVADFSLPSPDGAGPWRIADPLDQASLGRFLSPDDPTDGFPPSFQHQEPDPDQEEGYLPPEPPPLPRGDTISRLAWGAVLSGPAFLLVAALVWRTVPSLYLLLALLAFVAGFVTLVARMPSDHPDDPDDGAVV